MTIGAILHVVFGRSAAGSLEKALKLVGRDEPVIGLSDDFSFGPIASSDPGVRVRWVEEVLGLDDWDEVVGDSALFLSTSRSASRLNAWVSMRETSSYAGYLWWLSSMESVACAVTNVPRLSLSRSEELVHWLDRPVPLGSDELNYRQQQWRRLQVENGDLRVIVGNDLVSKPIDWFDDLLTGLATHEWQRMALIVGKALVATIEHDVRQVGDLVLSARLTSLAEAGALEWRGDLGLIQGCEIRLPS